MVVQQRCVDFIYPTRVRSRGHYLPPRHDTAFATPRRYLGHVCHDSPLNAVAELSPCPSPSSNDITSSNVCGAGPASLDWYVSAADRTASLWDGDADGDSAGDEKALPLHACSAIASGRRAREDQSHPIVNGRDCTELVRLADPSSAFTAAWASSVQPFTFQRFDSLQANFTCSSNSIVHSQPFEPRTGCLALTSYTALRNHRLSQAETGTPRLQGWGGVSAECRVVGQSVLLAAGRAEAELASQRG